MTTALLIVVMLSALAVGLLWQKNMARLREEHIRTFHFPKGLFAKVMVTYPHLTHRDMELVSRGLRQFFLAYLKSGRQHVAMPSQVADALWHEFILYTKSYQAFSKKAFGGFLHHTPAVMQSSQARSDDGLRRCWRHVCQEELINPRKPSRLPLLFALDSKLAIPNGYIYVPDCSGVRRQGDAQGGVVHCGAELSGGATDDGSNGAFSADSSLYHAPPSTDSDAAGQGDGGSGSDSGGGDGCGGGGCGGGGGD